MGSNKNAEQQTQTNKESTSLDLVKDEEDEVEFRRAQDFELLQKDSELSKRGSDLSKVYIKKNEIEALENIGRAVGTIRVPIDERQQRYYERDISKMKKIVLPESQELFKEEKVPTQIIQSTKESQGSFSSTELDHLKSYLVQLKELIARRELSWAKTTEKDYTQRVEIAKFRNEITHLRMLCEKRARDIKEKNDLVKIKENEIIEMNKKNRILQTLLTKAEAKEAETKRILENLTTLNTTEEEALSYKVSGKTKMRRNSEKSSHCNDALKMKDATKPYTSQWPAKAEYKSKILTTKKLCSVVEENQADKQNESVPESRQEKNEIYESMQKIEDLLQEKVQRKKTALTRSSNTQEQRKSSTGRQLQKTMFTNHGKESISNTLPTPLSRISATKLSPINKEISSPCTSYHSTAS